MFDVWFWFVFIYFWTVIVFPFFSLYFFPPLVLSSIFEFFFLLKFFVVLWNWKITPPNKNKNNKNKNKNKNKKRVVMWRLPSDYWNYTLQIVPLSIRLLFWGLFIVLLFFFYGFIIFLLEQLIGVGYFSLYIFFFSLFLSLFFFLFFFPLFFFLFFSSFFFSFYLPLPQ